MSNSEHSEVIETTTRVYLQREDARQSSFDRVFPMLVMVVIFACLGTVAISNSGGGNPTIHNNHHIEVNK